METFIIKTFYEQGQVTPTLEHISGGNDCRIIISNNPGGKISLVKSLINTIRKSSSKIRIEAEDKIASAAAFLWMYIHLAQKRGYFQNVNLRLPADNCMLIYHRPLILHEEKLIPITELPSNLLTDDLKDEVEESDKYLVCFLQEHNDYLVFPESNAESRRYSHEEIFELYQCNINIAIPIGKFNEFKPVI